jgi:hypothetical protein
MRRLLTIAPVAVAIAVSLAAGPAFGADSSGATDELKEGYALKQSGKCREAIPHFLASYKVDPKPKALLNLADCEAQVGELLAARGHAAEGRDLARQENDTELTGVADEQLDAIEKRLPRLTIRLAPGAVPRSIAIRDGSVLGATDLGAAVPMNPGVHHVVATAPGHAQREFDVTLAEGASAEVEVQPGLALDAANASSWHGAKSGGWSENSGPSTRQIVTFGALGLGAAGIVVGVATGIAAGSKHSALENECTGNNCPTSAQGDLDGFHSLRTWSTVGYVLGLAGLAAGAVLWFTSPSYSEKTPTSGSWITPSPAGLAGRF